ncbi:peptidoglycan recognition protein family protein [Mycolicibacterium sediminis]|nr:peptidoglycan recognition family protein [Mycolicibacterium sediminis]
MSAKQSAVQADVSGASSTSTNAPPAVPLDVPPAPASEVPPVSAGPSGVLLCRESWGAKPELPGGVAHSISRMTIHHTGAVLGDNKNAPGRLRQHQRLHQGERGWIDIAYHVGVDRNGNIYELRRPEIVGDTATEYNPTGHFLVLCEGDFDQEVVTEAQLDSAALAFAWAAQTYKISDDVVRGHRDFASTACPGADLYARVQSGDLQGRIEKNIAAGTVDLRSVCGPEAKDAVAKIEAGL